MEFVINKAVTLLLSCLILMSACAQSGKHTHQYPFGKFTGSWVKSKSWDKPYNKKYYKTNKRPVDGEMTFNDGSRFQGRFDWDGEPGVGTWTGTRGEVFQPTQRRGTQGIFQASHLGDPSLRSCGRDSGEYGACVKGNLKDGDIRFQNGVVIRQYRSFLSNTKHQPKIEIKGGIEAANGDLLALLGNSGGVTNNPFVHYWASVYRLEGKIASYKEYLEQYREDGHINYNLKDGSPFMIAHQSQKLDPNQHYMFSHQWKRASQEDLNVLFSGTVDSGFHIKHGVFKRSDGVFLLGDFQYTIYPDKDDPKKFRGLVHENEKVWGEVIFQGRRYIGELKNEQPHGYGALLNGTSLDIEGHFIAGKIQEPYKKYSSTTSNWYALYYYDGKIEHQPMEFTYVLDQRNNPNEPVKKKISFDGLNYQLAQDLKNGLREGKNSEQIFAEVKELQEEREILRLQREKKAKEELLLAEKHRKALRHLYQTNQDLKTSFHRLSSMSKTCDAFWSLRREKISNVSCRLKNRESGDPRESKNCVSKRERLIDQSNREGRSICDEKDRFRDQLVSNLKAQDGLQELKTWTIERLVSTDFPHPGDPAGQLYEKYSFFRNNLEELQRADDEDLVYFRKKRARDRQKAQREQDDREARRQAFNNNRQQEANAGALQALNKKLDNLKARNKQLESNLKSTPPGKSTKASQNSAYQAGVARSKAYVRQSQKKWQVEKTAKSPTPKKPSKPKYTTPKGGEIKIGVFKNDSSSSKSSSGNSRISGSPSPDSNSTAAMTAAAVTGAGSRSSSVRDKEDKGDTREESAKKSKPKPYITKSTTVVSVVPYSYAIDTATDLAITKVMNHMDEVCGNNLKASVDWRGAPPTCTKDENAKNMYYCKQVAVIQCWSDDCTNHDRRCGQKARDFAYPGYSEVSRKDYELEGSTDWIVIK